MHQPFQYPALIPYLTADNAAALIDFYKAAFGAEERYRLTDSARGTIGHAELLIAGQCFMVSDEFPGMNQSPKSLGGATTQFVLMVPNADAAYDQALAAGATSVRPPDDQFYGYRMALIQDPAGHQWMLQHEIERIAPDDMQKRWDHMVSQCTGQASC